VGRLPAGIGIPSEEGTRDLVTDGSSVNGPSKTRRTLDYWATVLWLTAGTVPRSASEGLDSSRPTGGAESDRVCDADHMSLVLRRWRHKYSPAARRGREAARKLTAHLEYTAWVAEQRALTRRADAMASEKR